MNNQAATATSKVFIENSAALADLATKYGFGSEAVQLLFKSIIAGHGGMAQFSHPEFGGLGQWTRGGMIMIGDMFNHSLKNRVSDLCSDLAGLIQNQQTSATSDSTAIETDQLVENWWGTELGAFSSSGSQNNSRYAYFPSTHRLAILDGKEVKIYDTGDHHITGVSQQQSISGSLTFTSQHGPVSSADLAIVSETNRGTTVLPNHEPNQSRAPSVRAETIKPSQPVSSAGKATQDSQEVFSALERLAELRDRSILSEEEFLAKKSELLTRV